MNLYDYLDPDSYKTWSNVKGFGNIEMNFVQDDHIVKSKIPWNRIPALTRPASTPINPNNSWSPSSKAPVSQERMRNLIKKNCNLCRNYPDCN